MNKIIVFGSINTDLAINTPYLPVSGETIIGSDFTIFQGGKGANQAVAASRLGADVIMFGSVGDDSFGSMALKSLKKEKVSIENIEVINCANTAVAMIIKVGNENRIILDIGANRYLTLNKLNNFLVCNELTGAVFITQLENEPSVVYEAIKLSKKAKMSTIFNPAPARLIPKDIYNYLDYLIINETEAEILTNIYPSTEESIKAIFYNLNKEGLENLILTLGARGSYVITKDICKKINSIKVKATDSTGAGDAYIGALAYCLANNKDIINSCIFASYAAALSVTKSGAQTALPTLKEVNNFKRRKQLEN